MCVVGQSINEQRGGGSVNECVVGESMSEQGGGGLVNV